MEPISFFIYSFTSVFTIVNPIGGLLTYVSLTSAMSGTEKRNVARRAVITACILAIFFAVSGEVVLRVFSVTVDSLRVAGGILLFLVAADMMLARVSRESVTTEEIHDASKKQDISIFPIAMPLLTGPGAITTVIVLIRTAHTIQLKMVAIGAILLTFALSYAIFRFSDKVNRILGVTGTLVITRIMGLLLAAIAVNFVALGTWNIFKSFAQ